MAAQVITVLGPVASDVLGFTDAHTHGWIAPVAGAAPGAPQLDEEQAIAEELVAYRRAGGHALVDCQPDRACGRDGNVLLRLARRSGVAIVASTGFHRRRYYGAEAPLFGATVESVCNHFMGEIVSGLRETRGAAQPVRPGLIKVAGEATLAATPLALLEGAAWASQASGYAIQLHTERGAAAEAFLEQFRRWGVAPERLVFCHMDKRSDLGLHRELAEAGVMLEYDTFFRPQYEPARRVWPLIERMVAAGLEARVALATDMADPALWQFGGGPGPMAFLSAVKPRLEAMGVGETTVRALLGGNIVRRLAISTAIVNSGG